MKDLVQRKFELVDYSLSGHGHSSQDLTGPRSASVSMSVTQTLSSTVITLINFDTILFDEGSNYNTTTHRFTAPITGYYEVTATVAFTSTTTPTLTLYKNNATYQVLGRHSSASVKCSGMTTLLLNAGDYLDLRVTSTNNRTISATLNSFTISYLY